MGLPPRGSERLSPCSQTHSNQLSPDFQPRSPAQSEEEAKGMRLPSVEQVRLYTLEGGQVPLLPHGDALRGHSPGLPAAL